MKSKHVQLMYIFKYGTNISSMKITNIMAVNYINRIRIHSYPVNDDDKVRFCLTEQFFTSLLILLLTFLYKEKSFL